MGTMKNKVRVTIASLLVLAIYGSMTACTRTSGSESAYSTPSCSQLLTAAVKYVRSDTGDIDLILQALSDSCSDEFEIATDYLSNSSMGEFRIDSCEELLAYRVRAESVALLEQDGLCKYGTGEPVTAPDWPDGGLGWDKARDHAGTVHRVCGPLTSARETSDGTFVNIGADYPSADRFTFIFWDVYLERIEPGATICGRGQIYLYKGVAQMEMRNPSELEIWR